MTIDAEGFRMPVESVQTVSRGQPYISVSPLQQVGNIIGTDAVLAKKYLVKLSNFLRFTISAHENAIISLSDELNFLQLVHPSVLLRVLLAGGR